MSTPFFPAAAAPWSRATARLTALGNGLGFSVVIAGWLGASGRVTLASQSKWAVLSVTGLVVAGSANVGLLRAGRRTIRRGQRGLHVVMGPGSSSVPSSDGSAARELVSGPRLSFFHRADCRLVRGKAVQAAGRRAHERNGRRPCGVCRP